MAQILKISAAYSPPPPEGFVSPMTWGIESNVIERFGAAGVPQGQDLVRRETPTRSTSPVRRSQLVDAFRNYYGPTMNAFDAAEKNGRAADLQKELEDAVRQPEQEPDAGRDVDSRDVPARDRRPLR